MVIGALLVAACGPDVEGDLAIRVPDTAGVIESLNPEPFSGALAAGAAVRLEVAPTGNEVRYRVREQLVNLELPNDAIGKTNAVTGSITLDSAGKVIPDGSRIVVEVAGLTSDKDRRDGYVRRRLLQTDSFPTVVLAPKEIRGLTYPLPASGSRTYDLVGDLTLKGVTRPTTWKVTANFGRDTVTGSAATRFTFKDFDLTQPRVPVVLSVADTIGLEYDFKLAVVKP
jgi:polyisoprenoid-binding protein YceI